MRVVSLTCATSTLLPCTFAFLVVLVTIFRRRDPTYSSIFRSTSEGSQVGTAAHSFQLTEQSSSDDRRSRQETSRTTMSGSLPSCSFRVFRDHLRGSNISTLSGIGTWSRRQTGSMGNGGGVRRRGLALGQLQASHIASNVSVNPLFRFQPALCSLSHGAWLPRPKLSSCLCRMNMTYIVLNGDSNVWRLFRLSNKFLVGGGGTDDSSTGSDAGSGGLGAGGRRAGIRCERVASHDGKLRGKPGPFEGGAYMPRKRPNCSIVYRLVHWHLPPDYYRCWIDCPRGEVPLSIQYLPMTSDWTPYDQFIVPELSGCRSESTVRDNETTENVNQQPVSPRNYASYQEFLYSEYYATEPRPDLVLHFSSSHEQLPLSEIASKAGSLANLFRRLQGQSSGVTSSSRQITRTVVISKPSENVRLKPKKWRDVRYESDNITRAEWIDAANRILHSKMAPLFTSSDNRSKNVFMFPDLPSMMNPVIDELAVDGVHASSFWYRTLWSYIVQTLCAADIRDL